ncbi:DUF6463 family protein [Nocardia sp. NPDC051030]|uniref:DUF6463 family protein n=1 Tax=Nocardia sp. NPDC051030 TaxID=3155162 RepID=UPI00341BB533
MSATATEADRLASATAGKLTIWAGRLLIAIGVLHIVAFVLFTHDSWSGWATGELHSGDPDKDFDLAVSTWRFWALPGGFAVPLIVLGALMVRTVRNGRIAPAYAGWSLGAWVLLNSYLLFPSGFLLGFIPVGLLIAADRINRKAALGNRTPTVSETA